MINWKLFLLSTGLVMNSMGAIFLAVPLLKSDKQIEKDAGTYWGVILI